MGADRNRNDGSRDKSNGKKGGSQKKNEKSSNRKGDPSSITKNGNSIIVEEDEEGKSLNLIYSVHPRESSGTRNSVISHKHSSSKPSKTSSQKPEMIQSSS